MDEVLEEIHKKMEDGVRREVFPGATYAILYKGQTFFNVVGNKSLYPKVETNGLHTIYDLASLTKVIVINFLIGKLLEKGIINLTDPIKKHFPTFRHTDITIADVLTHSSGLPANVNWRHIKTKEEYLNLILNVDQKIEKGKEAVYSDIGFIILGKLIETVTNTSLDILANDYIFSKLEMFETRYNPIDIERCAPTEKEGDIYIRGVVHDKKARLFNGVAGHSGVFSPIYDVVKYAQMILNDGVYKNNQIISKDIIEMWYQPIISDLKGRNRTLGWIEGASADLCPNISKKAIYHPGFTGTRLLIDKGNEIAIIVLSNQVHPNRNNEAFGDFWMEVANLIYKLLIV